MAAIARGDILNVYDRLTAEELAMLINLGGELPANARDRANRMANAFRIVDSYEREGLPRRGVRFEAIDPHQVGELIGDIESRKIA